jgi:hypothetical protein
MTPMGADKGKEIIEVITFNAASIATSLTKGVP